MRISIICIVSACCFGLSSLGCGSTVTPGGEESNQEPEPEEEFVQELPDVALTATELASARCEVIYDCCNSQERLNVFGMEGESAEDCAANTGAQFPGLGATGALAAAISNGNAIFHEHRAELCNEALLQQGCSDFQGTDEYVLTLPGCRDIVQGLLEDGEACSNGFECESRNCHYAELSENGVCMTLPRAEGQECYQNNCGGMTYCHPNTDLCVQKHTLGAECFWDYECNTGYCGDAENDEKRCMEPPPVCGG